MKRLVIKGFIGCCCVVCFYLTMSLSVYAMEYQYDKLNRLTKVTYEDGSYVTYEYDANGNIVNTKKYEVKKNPNTDPTDDKPSDDKPSDDKPSNDKPVKEVSREKNENGKVTKITYEDGSYATYEYDNSGDVAKKVEYNSDGSIVRETTGESIEDPNTKEDIKETPKEDKKEKSPVEKAIDKVIKGIKKFLKSISDFFKGLF